MFILNKCVSPRFAVDFTMNYHDLETVFNFKTVLISFLDIVFENLNLPFSQVHKPQIPFAVLIRKYRSSGKLNAFLVQNCMGVL